jgi:hypothetical protein
MANKLDKDYLYKVIAMNYKLGREVVGIDKKMHELMTKMSNEVIYFIKASPLHPKDKNIAASEYNGKFNKAFALIAKVTYTNACIMGFAIELMYQVARAIAIDDYPLTLKEIKSYIKIIDAKLRLVNKAADDLNMFMSSYSQESLIDGPDGDYRSLSEAINELPDVPEDVRKDFDDVIDEALNEREKWGYIGSSRGI